VTNPASYRPKAGEIPTQPGVYKFRDARGRVIYVGKAKNLRARLSSYFQDVGQDREGHLSGSVGRGGVGPGP